MSARSAEAPRGQVLLAVTGGVAAFKAVLLLRLLQRAGFSVQVICTSSALRFVGEPTFHALSGRPVASDAWDLRGAPSGERHVELARDAVAMIVYPATSRALGSLAEGITDDLVGLTASCMRGPVLLFPAMHSAMAAQPAIDRALATLRADGRVVVDPVVGPLASGEIGFGRLPEPEVALEALEAALRPQDLAGRTVLVSAGPTREHLDPVRFLSNPSTGRMGFAVARAARRRGARVILVSGPSDESTPLGVERRNVVSASQMGTALHEAFATCDALVMTAAVADFRPVDVAPGKVKKQDGALLLSLERSEDLLVGLAGRRRVGQVLVGFAMETSDLVQNARDKLVRKGLDLVVANDLFAEGAGFAGSTNVVTLVDAEGEEALPRLRKIDVADRILDRCVARFARGV